MTTKRQNDNEPVVMSSCRHVTFLLSLEFIALYVALPLVLWRVAVSGVAKMWVLPWLWVAAVVATVWLIRKRGWTWKRFFGFEGVTRWDWLKLGLRVMVGAIALAIILHWLMPEALFKFPQTKPSRWLVVMLMYPVLSVFPQGVVCRALFFERYARLFGGWASAVAAVAFSLAHIVFNNPHALILTLAGGVIFTWQYRAKGMMFANVEHTLFGNLAFTIGWGIFLHGGTLALRGGG